MFADVPTTAEFGLPDVRMETWFGLTAPPNLPEPIVARLAREIEAVARQQSFARQARRIGCAVAFMPQSRVRGVHRAGRQKMGAADPGDGHFAR